MKAMQQTQQQAAEIDTNQSPPPDQTMNQTSSCHLNLNYQLVTCTAVRAHASSSGAVVSTPVLPGTYVMCSRCHNYSILTPRRRRAFQTPAVLFCAYVHCLKSPRHSLGRDVLVAPSSDKLLVLTRESAYPPTTCKTVAGPTLHQHLLAVMCHTPSPRYELLAPALKPKLGE